MSNMERFHSKRDQNYIFRTRNILRELPSFCEPFFRAIENTTTAQTRYAYAIDLRTFFQYAIAELSSFDHKTDIKDFSLVDLETFAVDDIEHYLSYISYYLRDNSDSRDGVALQNHERAKLRKLSAIRALFKHLHKKQLIKENITALVESPRLHDKPIIRLEPNEAADLLDAAENGSALSKHAQNYHKQNQKRDTAILTLLLGTGIRVSELVGLDIDDLDFKSGAFRITRKGGSVVQLYFGDEVDQALSDYFEERKRIIAVDGHQNAFFLSIQRKRLTARAVQNLVKKYSKMATPLKNISPHKLRSTYGTMLYQETGDIYLVADVLGHRDVNTTKKHYAAQSDLNRRKAARAIQLRDTALLSPEERDKNEE